MNRDKIHWNLGLVASFSNFLEIGGAERPLEGKEQVKECHQGEGGLYTLHLEGLGWQNRENGIKKHLSRVLDDYRV